MEAPVVAVAGFTEAAYAEAATDQGLQPA